jgi:hypothetical protein
MDKRSQILWVFLISITICSYQMVNLDIITQLMTTGPTESYAYYLGRLVGIPFAIGVILYALVEKYGAKHEL